jgi:hypothetical protein
MHNTQYPTISSANFVQKTNNFFLHDSSDSSAKWKDRFVLLFCNLFSAKQSIRPDNFFECLKEVLPQIKRIALLELSRIFFATNRILGRQNEKKNNQNLQALDLLFAIEQSLSNKTTTNISLEEKKLLIHLLNHLTASQENLSSFENWLMLTRQGKERFKAFQTCKDLTKVLFDNKINFLEKKLQVIEQLLQATEKPTVFTESFLSNTSKITPFEYRLLFLAHGKITLLNQFKELGIVIDQMQELNRQWDRLEALNEGPVLTKLRELTLKELEQAQLFFGHRFTLRKIRDQYADLEGIIKAIFIGTLNHVGIVTKGKTGINLSHVGVPEGKHTIKPVSDPLFFAFMRTAKLDILPLIPASVSIEHKELLSKVFVEAFEQIASVERLEIAFEEDSPFLKTVLVGHKNFNPTKLSNIEFKPPQKMRCSVYVTMVFLQTIQVVNQKLLELGYNEAISHPFGRYESLYRMDPLRLYYHFKRLNIIRPI